MTNDEIVRSAMDADTRALGGQSLDIWIKADRELYNSAKNIKDSNPTLYSQSMALWETNNRLAYDKWQCEMESRGMA